MDSIGVAAGAAGDIFDAQLRGFETGKTRSDGDVFGVDFGNAGQGEAALLGAELQVFQADVHLAAVGEIDFRLANVFQLQRKIQRTIEAAGGEIIGFDIAAEVRQGGDHSAAVNSIDDEIEAERFLPQKGQRMNLGLEGFGDRLRDRSAGVEAAGEFQFRRGIGFHIAAEPDEIAFVMQVNPG